LNVVDSICLRLPGAQVGVRGPVEAPFDREFVAVTDGLQWCEQGANLLGAQAGRAPCRGASRNNDVPAQ